MVKCFYIVNGDTKTRTLHVDLLLDVFNFLKASLKNT